MKNKDEENFDENDDLDDENDGKGSKNTKHTMKRPIICICNDLYAKVISDLRKEALVFHLKKANPLKLLTRLKEICLKEKLYLDESFLKTICEKSNFDIRTSVNLLQFIANNKENIENMKNLINSNFSRVIGNKDINENFFDVMKKLLNSETNSSFHDVLHIYNTFGEINNLHEGIHANVWNLNKEKENLKETLKHKVKTLDLLSLDDNIRKDIYLHQTYDVYQFRALPGYYLKNKLSSKDKQKSIEFPTIFNEFKKNSVNLNIFN